MNKEKSVFEYDLELVYEKARSILKKAEELKTSESLSFLKNGEKYDNSKDTEYWSLYSETKQLPPLKFSNNKTQENVVKEVVSLINEGKKVIFIHGVCGSGKSGIALNIARALGKTSIIVPIKSLQRQYEEEYMEKKYLLNKEGRKLKIAMITGRENHDSVIIPGVSCADPTLPDTIKFTEKFYKKLREYYMENPFIKIKEMPDLKNLRRISVAPANPYWSPIMPANFELTQLKDATKKKYIGANGNDYIFYHRKRGCSYYDQYQAYIDADVIIFNSAKYLLELAIGRKPLTEVEIIDECDEFLDSLTNQSRINLTRLGFALKSLVCENEDAQDLKKRVIELIENEEKNKRALGIDENKIYEINETRIMPILKSISAHADLEAEIILDENNYANTALEAARDYEYNFEEVFVSYDKEDEDLYVNLVTTNLSKKFNEIKKQSKAIVLMSGTLHSPSVLKNIFGIEDFSIVQAEDIQHGAIEVHRTGKEFDCRYSNFEKGKHTRKDYLNALSTALEKAKKPALVHVNAFSDLPNNEEINELGLDNLISKEDLIGIQNEDKEGKRIREFKEGKFNTLFSTKCSRGMDFPGSMCNSVIFTKYPNPNTQDIFWKILQKTHPQYFWDFYKDKARREFLQRIFRAIRFKEDHIYVLSPDLRVIEAVKKLQ